MDGGRRAVWYVGLLVGILLAVPAKATPTYTGGPFNFCLPTSDDYDWADCVNYDFTVMNSSWSSLGTASAQVGVDTQTLRNDLTSETAARIAADALKVDKNAPDQINLSTVTTALAAKADLFTGISSSCAAGYFLSSSTYVNGVVTGGGCVAANANAGGQIGHTIATSSDPAYTASYYTQRSTLTFDDRFFSVTDSAGDRGTFVSFSSAPMISSTTAHMASVTGITATSWDGCNIADSTITIVTRGISNRSLILHSAMVSNSLTGADVYLRVLLDGAPLTDAHATAAQMAAGANSNATLNASFARLTPELSSGTHSLCIGMWVSAGTGRYSRDIAGTYLDNSFGVVELMGSAISGGGGATDGTKVLKAGDTMTGALVMSGTNITLTGSAGYVTSASSGNFSGVFAHLTGNVTGNVTGNATTATALAANPAACSAGDFVTDIDANGTLTCATPAGAAGETNTYGIGGGTKTFGSTVQASSFTTTENSTYAITSSSGIWMKAGMFRLPDATVFYSTAQFRGVDNSTQTLLTANATAINGANTFVSGTNECYGSTITFATKGSSVIVSFSGSVKGGTTTSHTAAGFLVDGALPAGQTSTGGIVKNYTATSTAIMNMSYTRRVTGLTPGSHTFCPLFRSASASNAALDNTDAYFEAREP